MQTPRPDDILEGTQEIADALGFRGPYVNVRRRIVTLVARGLPAWQIAPTAPYRVKRSALLAWWDTFQAELVEATRAAHRAGAANDAPTAAAA